MDQKDKVAQMADVTFTPVLQDYFLTFILYYNSEMQFFFYHNHSWMPQLCTGPVEVEACMLWSCF